MESLSAAYACLQRGQVADAERIVHALMRTGPDDPALHRAHAAVAQAMGRMEVAVQAMRTAVALAPQDARLRLELGQALGAAGDQAAAADAFLASAALRPDEPRAWALAGLTLYGLRREHEGLGPLLRAHALLPSDLQVLRVLAETEYALERHADAQARFEQLAATGAFTDALLPLRRSQCARRLGNPARALSLVDDALRRFPDDAPLWLERGWVHEDLGDARQARESYARARALRPGWADPLGSEIALARTHAPPELLGQAEALARSDGLPAQQRAFLHHVLGKHADAAGDYAAAAAHWSDANRLRRTVDGGFDRDAFSRGIDRAIAALDRGLLAARRRVALRDPRPFFIVGMPRSGTTLAEQILAAHPQVHGCGERVGIADVAEAIARLPGMRWPEDAVRLDPGWCRERATAYLQGAGDAAAARPVDKQPYNFLHVGLIAMLLADARIAWCRRDPRDVALSIYSESMSPDSSYATDLGDIRFVIDGHERLMRHWQAVSPLPILEVAYEEVVADVEAAARRLVAFAGLAWDDACLAFHEGRRPVQTLSRWQVRQPVHTRSVGRWRNYAQWFESASPSRPVEGAVARARVAQGFW